MILLADISRQCLTTYVILKRFPLNPILNVIFNPTERQQSFLSYHNIPIAAANCSSTSTKLAFDHLSRRHSHKLERPPFPGSTTRTWWLGACCVTQLYSPKMWIQYFQLNEKYCTNVTKDMRSITSILPSLNSKNKSIVLYRAMPSQWTFVEIIYWNRNELVS